MCSERGEEFEGTLQYLVLHRFGSSPLRDNKFRTRPEGDEKSREREDEGAQQKRMESFAVDGYSVRSIFPHRVLCLNHRDRIESVLKKDGAHPW